jgi:hypothetical protein
MTLDDLIEALQALRVQHPGAGTAYVHSPAYLDALSYEKGEVQLGFAYKRKRSKRTPRLRPRKSERVH